VRCTYSTSTAVLALVARAAHEAARAGALHDDVDAAARVHDQPHVDGVARALQRRPDDAIGERTGRLGPTSTLSLSSVTRITRKNSFVFLPMTCALTSSCHARS
jgi:IS5 family transposase